jgi:transglutaminase-like putative cysteine protease
LSRSPHYKYDRLVSLGPQIIQLRPAPHSRTPILSYSLTLTPSEHIFNWQLDPHSNYAARVLLLQKTSQFAVHVQLVADLAPINPFNFFLEPGFEDYPFQYSASLKRSRELCQFGPNGWPPAVVFASVSREKRGTIDFLVDLNRRVRDGVDYVTRLEPGVQSCEQTLEFRSGSCRDSAWLFVQILRQLGIAARFVSGYLIQLASDEPQDSIAPRSDSADLHAWVEAFLPGAGWIGMDATRGCLRARPSRSCALQPPRRHDQRHCRTVKVEFSNSISVRRRADVPRTSQPQRGRLVAAKRVAPNRADQGA